MNIKLRTRITLLVMIILIACVGAVTFFSVASSNKFFGAIPASNVFSLEESNIMAQNTITITPKPIEADPLQGTLSIEIKQAQRGFQLWQIAAMVSVVIIGGIITNTIIRKSLMPLSDLSLAIGEIDAGKMDLEIPPSKNNDEVGSLTKSFQSMLSRLQDAFDIQKNFAESAAHELKTPLATMKSSLQVLMLDENMDKDDIEESIKLQLLQIDKLTGIVDQLLQITDSKIELNQEINMNELIMKSIEKGYDLMGSKDIMINYDIEDIYIHSNLVLVSSIIDNLISNAVKYSEQGKIEIDLKRHNDEIIFAVADEGIGIDEKDLPYLFDSFFRTDDVKIKQLSGNGLGLRIAKAAVDKLNGTINVESQKGKGSKFTVKLPLL